MPSNRSYLAAETEIVHKLIQKMGLSIVSTDSLFPTCAHPDGPPCSCIRVQAIKTGTETAPKIQNAIESHTGAIIIGERIRNHLSRSKPTGGKPEVVYELANATSNPAQIMIPSGDGCHNRAEHGKDSTGRRLGMFNVPTLRHSALSPLNVDKMY